MIINNFKTIKNFIPTISYSLQNNEQTLNISHTDLIFSLTVLKKHLNFQYNLLSCISGVDLLINQYRLSVVYDFLSLTFNSRVRVKTFVNEVTPVDSIVSLYRNSNWWEREIWDLFGVYFQNHPDLRRLLTDYGFEGYPLRKDFPLSGYVEVRYDSIKKRIIVEPLELSQEFRLFNYETPW